jgi:hypothetical protein
MEQPSMQFSGKRGEKSGSWTTKESESGSSSGLATASADVPIEDLVAVAHVESGERPGYIRISISGSAAD